MSLSPEPEHHEAELPIPTDARLAERAKKRRRTGATNDVGNQETGLMRDGVSPGLPRFVGSGSGIHFVRAVYDILARSTGQPSRGQSQLVPGEDDQLLESGPGNLHGSGASDGASFWRDDELSSEPGTVTFEALVSWTRNYFTIWHPLFPFLHGPDVLNIFEKVAENGFRSLSAPDAAVVRALVSISLADGRQLPSPGDVVPVPTNLLFLSLDHVASSMLFTLGTPASLKNMQAALCVELFLVSMLKFNMASRLGGIVVRMAYHLGLHRCPKRYPNFSLYEISMRKRIWWSFYCLERLVCQALGLPLDVQDDDVDVCLPTSEAHHSTAENEIPHQNKDDGSEQRQLRVLALLSKHAQIRGRILELRHKSLHKRHDTVERAFDVQSRLTGWSNEVHDIVMDNQSEEEDGVSDGASTHEHEPMSALHSTLFSVLEHESTIALNRPLLAKKPATFASGAALQACIHASRAIIETLDDRRVLSQESVTHNTAPLQALMAWPLMTWSVWMSCFILAFAALQGETSPSSAQRYAKRSLRILEQLSKRGTAWPATCSQAVQHLMSALEQRDTAGLKDNAATQPFSVQVPASKSAQPTSADADPPGDGGRRRGNRILAAPSNSGFAHTSLASGPQPDSAGMSDARIFSSTSVSRGTPQVPQIASEEGLLGADALSDAIFMRQSTEDTVDLDDQSWLFDPLSALDFSNFAQAGSADSSMGFTFY